MGSGSEVPFGAPEKEEICVLVSALSLERCAALDKSLLFSDCACSARTVRNDSGVFPSAVTLGDQDGHCFCVKLPATLVSDTGRTQVTKAGIRAPTWGGRGREGTGQSEREWISEDEGLAAIRAEWMEGERVKFYRSSSLLLEGA